MYNGLILVVLRVLGVLRVPEVLVPGVLVPEVLVPGVLVPEVLVPEVLVPEARDMLPMHGPNVRSPPVVSR